MGLYGPKIGNRYWAGLAPRGSRIEGFFLSLAAPHLPPSSSQGGGSSLPRIRHGGAGRGTFMASVHFIPSCCGTLPSFFVILFALKDNFSFDFGETRRTWKPNVQEKRLFSYALDRHIRVKVTTHALRCIDKAGGIDEYLLKTPYQRMDTEMGLLWKAKIEKLYQELGQAEAFFFSPEEEARIEAGFEEYRAAKRAAKKSSSQDPAAEGGAS
ncbi:unnamed protein product [Spirodela intermedia]|uniref:Large ribosomal subunit protein bL28m n=1 Tax=Spirodela intermedia TaxID=51605 RepID=A0A7I8JJH4_SPIIN|nr:unnamed protein product [Spirodela intermedia]CAA6670316.1 unnamed protein product [Spirodela intermedia]